MDLLLSIAFLFNPSVFPLVTPTTPAPLPQKEEVVPPSPLYSEPDKHITASWYGPGFDGNLTANGEVFNQYDLTVAHKSLPFGTLVRFTLNGRSVVARVNDRGPYVEDREFDLSLGAAQAIGLDAQGVATVAVTYLN